MNITEAAKLMRRRHMMRVISWPEHMYIYDRDDLVIDETGKEIELTMLDLLSEDWEEYVEEKPICIDCTILNVTKIYKGNERQK